MTSREDTEVQGGQWLAKNHTAGCYLDLVSLLCASGSFLRKCVMLSCKSYKANPKIVEGGERERGEEKRG